MLPSGTLQAAARIGTALRGFPVHRGCETILNQQRFFDNG